MKQELHPAAIVGIIVIVVALVVVFGARALKPASYTPSPGVGQGDAPGSKPGSVQTTVNTENAPATVAPDKNTYYPAAPAGAIPGRPVKSGQ